MQHLPRVVLSLSTAALLAAGCSSGLGDPASSASPATGADVQLPSFALGGSVSNLTGAGLVLGNGDARATVAAGSTTFTMPATLAAGDAYAVTVVTQPAGQRCSVANGTGTIGQADSRNDVVTCADDAHSVGGSVAGLSAAGLVLANGADTLGVPSGASSFVLAGQVARSGSYDVRVQVQPTGLNCAVANGQGQVADTDVTSVAVSCSAAAHTLGGTISGLSAGGLVLSAGSDVLPVSSGATAFTMPASIAYGAAYSLAVSAQPAGLTCSVGNGSATMGASDVTSVVVTCAVNSHAVGGSVSGLTTSGLVLANGGDTVIVAANATNFALPTAVAEGAAYAVTVQSQPTGLTCAAASATGTMGSSDVSNVAVTCATNSYTLGGTISGLGGNGLVLANGTDTLSVAANATVFTMPAAVPFGAGYAVVAQSQPKWVQCSASNGSGTMPASAVSNVAVSCGQNAEVSTIAGTWGVNGSTDDTGPAASFYRPFGIARNSAGDFFVGDLNNNLIRRVTPAGVVTTFAGSTLHGSQDGTGTAAGFYGPAGIAIDSSDNLYVVDRLNYLIRKITPAGVVTTLAGTVGSPGSANGTGTSASFASVYGLAVDSGGNVYVAEMSSNQIRKITPAGVVTTFAGSSTPGSADGNGASASFTAPAGIAVDAQDNVYVSEVGTHRIRKITPSGDVTTIAGAGTAGNNDGTGAAAKFNQPYGLTVDSDGVIYVADTIGNKIRRVTQAGVVTTLSGPVGLATSGHADANGTLATWYLPTNLTFDAAGNLWVADYNNNTIRKIAR